MLLDVLRTCHAAYIHFFYSSKVSVVIGTTGNINGITCFSCDDWVHFFEVFGGGGASKLGLLLICFALEVTYNMCTR